MNLFKKRKKQIVTIEERYRCFDNISYYHEQSLNAYLHLHKKKETELTKEHHEEIACYAGTHIAFFLTWIILHRMEGDFHKEHQEAFERFRKEELSGMDILLTYCDGKFVGEDINDDIFPFVNAYYETSYQKDYVQWVVQDLCDLPFEFVGSWEDYHAFAPILDNAYHRFLQSK